MADLSRRSRSHAQLEAETDLVIVTVEDEVSSHALVGGGAEVRVIAAGESWPVHEVKSASKDG